MVRRFFAGLGIVLLTILKGITWLLLGILKLALSMAKVFLLLFGSVARAYPSYGKG